MKRTKLASRYAKAFFDFAQEQGKVENVFTDVAFVDKTFDDNRELRFTIHSPVVRVDKKLAIINALFEGKVDEITLRYLQLILKKGRELHIDTICSEFVKLYKKYNNIVTLYITSADELTKECEEEIVAKIKSYINANIDVKKDVKPDLIGGYRLYFDDYYIDASVKGSLDKLRKELIDKSYQVNF